MNSVAPARIPLYVYGDLKVHALYQHGFHYMYGDPKVHELCSTSTDSTMCMGILKCMHYVVQARIPLCVYGKYSYCVFVCVHVCMGSFLYLKLSQDSG